VEDKWLFALLIISFQEQVFDAFICFVGNALIDKKGQVLI
jgi:hypothetical protein